MDDSVQISKKEQAEINKLEAEKEHLFALKRKTNIEIDEIEARKNNKWFKSRFLIQGLIAGLVTSGLLAAWLIGYWQPIMSVKMEENQIQDDINKLNMHLVSLKQDSLDKQNIRLKAEQLLIKEQYDSLEKSFRQIKIHSSKLNSEVAYQKAELKRLLAKIDNEQSNSELRTYVQKSIDKIDIVESSANKTAEYLDFQKFAILSKNELRFTKPIGPNSSKQEVKKVQEWLNLQHRTDSTWDLTVEISGEYSNETTNAVKYLQQRKGLIADGIVGALTYLALTMPMQNALMELEPKETFAATLVAYAKQHLAQNPSELAQNKGPWVRLYMDGNEGVAMAWTVGFVKFVLDQTCKTYNKKFTSILPFTYSADAWGSHALREKLLKRNNTGYIPKPGDIFLKVKTETDWTHAGIVTAVEGDFIFTIEGNSNDEGSRIGYEVCAKKRNYKTNKIDFIDLSAVK